MRSVLLRSARIVCAICMLAGVAGCGGQAARHGLSGGGSGGTEPSGRLVYMVGHEDPPQCLDPPCRSDDLEPGAQSHWIETALANGDDRRRLTPVRTGTDTCRNGRPAFGGYPQISPTGRLIAIGHCSGVVMRNPHGRVERRVHFPGNVFTASWSPDEHALAVSSEASSGDLQPVRVVDLANGRRHKLNHHSVTEVRWSRRNLIGFWDVTLQRVAVLRPTGKVVSRLKHVDSNFAWAADGRRLAYPCAKGICVVRADGTHRHVVTRRCGQGDLPYVAWSPDGHWVACERGRDLVAVRIKDGAIRVIRKNGPGDLVASVDWGPDSQM
jgi:hypothetical protein